MNIPFSLLGMILFLMACGQEINTKQTGVSDQVVVDSISSDPRILHYVCHPTEVDIKFYWKGKTDSIFLNLGNLEKALASEGKTLLFGMNGGMFEKDRSPKGLYIEEGNLIQTLDTISKGFGNFYLQPNGVFYIHENGRAEVKETQHFTSLENIQYATQSGPMLIIDGMMHPAFNQGSPNLNIRNGVGIMADGRVLFAISKQTINFYDFATFFQKNGCRNALYLDGFVSKAYSPEQNWKQKGGSLGVLIGLTEKD